MSAARSFLLALLASAAMLVASPAWAKPAKAASKDAKAPAKAPSKLAGKVYITADRVKDQAPEALLRQFGSAPAQGTLGRQKNGHWSGTAVAFFKKPSVPGPIIVWVFDKADKQALKDNEPVQAITVESTPREIFVHEIDFDPDQGYNKQHAYLVRIGQIIAKKVKIYASGDVKLLK